MVEQCFHHFFFIKLIGCIVLIDKIILLLSAMCKLNKPSLHDLAQETGMPEITIKRQMSILRNTFKMDIVFITIKGAHGRQGYYQITSWGIIDNRAFIGHYAKEKNVAPCNFEWLL